MNTQPTIMSNRRGKLIASQPTTPQIVCRTLAILFATLFANQSLHAQWWGVIIPPDEGDSVNLPQRVDELPFNRLTYMQTSSDRDYYRFTAPANMEIRVRASADFWQDPSCIVYSPGTNRVWMQDHDSGPGRDARIFFDAIGGEEYVISVKNRRSGYCRVMIDSTDLVMNFEDSIPENTYSQLGYRLPTWERGNHFGSVFPFGNVRRRVEIQSYCLDRIIIDDVYMHRGNEEFFITRDFPRPVIADRSLSMEVRFSPVTYGVRTGVVQCEYRVASDNKYSSAPLAGIGVRNINASANFGMKDHGFNSSASDAFEDVEDAAHYHRFRAPVGGATWYRAVVYGIPNRYDRYDLEGTVFANGWGAGELAAPWSNGFSLNTLPVRAGQSVIVKTEISPNDVDPELSVDSDIRFPARYSVYVFFVPL